MSYSILFREFPLDHLETIAEVVSQIYQITLFDARTKIRRGWGFLENNIAEERAREIVDGLASRNIAAFSVPNKALRETNPPKMMMGFESDVGGFVPRLQLKQDQASYIPWQQVLILAAGGFYEEIVRHQLDPTKSCTSSMLEASIFMVAGLPIRLGDKKKKTMKDVKSNRFISFGQIVTSQGDAFYFNPDRFDFSGLGNQKQLNVSLNYRVMFSEFLRLCPVNLNWGARFLLNNQPLSMANYLKTKDFETELRWMFNVISFSESSI